MKQGARAAVATNLTRSARFGEGGLGSSLVCAVASPHASPGRHRDDPHSQRSAEHWTADYRGLDLPVALTGLRDDHGGHLEGASTCSAGR